jgi:hypothetical protein
MLIINLLGLLLITLIAWWFWIYTPKDVSVKKAVELTDNKKCCKKDSEKKSENKSKKVDE